MIDIVDEHKAKRLPGLIEVHTNKPHTKKRASDIAELKCERGEPLLIRIQEHKRVRYLPAQFSIVPGTKNSVIVNLKDAIL